MAFRPDFKLDPMTRLFLNYEGTNLHKLGIGIYWKELFTHASGGIIQNS